MCVWVGECVGGECVGGVVSVGGWVGECVGGEWECVGGWGSVCTTLSTLDTSTSLDKISYGD